MDTYILYIYNDNIYIIYISSQSEDQTHPKVWVIG